MIWFFKDNFLEYKICSFTFSKNKYQKAILKGTGILPLQKDIIVTIISLLGFSSLLCMYCSSFVQFL